MEEGEFVSSVAKAIAAALDYTTTPDTRNSAFAYLESIKAGDIRVLASTGLRLVRKNWPLEIRLHGYKMLQHLVRLRWEEFDDSERSHLAGVVFDLINEVASPYEQWALKSQTAALIAEVIRREGLSLWKESLPTLSSICDRGPAEAELVAMLLRWLPEDITIHNEDLEGERRRLLLRGLTESLPDILRLLYNLLEKNFSIALSQVSANQVDVARQHAAVVTAAINAANAYAEWAPITDLAKYGLIHGCGFLLSSVEFRLHAGEFFKIVASRKRPTDAVMSEYNAAISSIFRILTTAAKDFLQRSSSNPSNIDEREYEFAECICEGMSSLGSSNLQCIAGDDSLLPNYLQEMLGYFGHYKFTFHLQSLYFWQIVIKESLSKSSVSSQTASDQSIANQGGSSLQKEKKWAPIQLSDDFYGIILDVSFQKLLKKPVLPGVHLPAVEREMWTDDFDSMGEFGQYRSRILDIVRIISSCKLIVASERICQRVESAIGGFLHGIQPTQDISVLEGTQVALETVVNAIFDNLSDPVADCSPEVRQVIGTIFQGLLQQLLSLNWKEPTLIEVTTRFLDGMGPFLKYFPEATGGVIRKLFELLTSLPVSLMDPFGNLARRTRLQICTSFLRIAKAAGTSLLPHMKDIADTMAQLKKDGQLLQGEHNLLGESFLVMASAAGLLFPTSILVFLHWLPAFTTTYFFLEYDHLEGSKYSWRSLNIFYRAQQQQEVLAWLLEPMSKQWTDVQWQSVYFSDLVGLARLVSDPVLMWSVFHSLTFFERALKRSGRNKSSSSHDPNNMHPMAAHLPWILPPVVQLLGLVHSLWSQPVAEALPVELRNAMSMSQSEQAALLGEVSSKLSKDPLSSSDGSVITKEEGHLVLNEADIRNWLKCIRDSGYTLLGLSMNVEDCFFRCLESNTVAVALVGNIQSMEFRHIRQLIHLVLNPIVKFCPVDLWESWLEKFLLPVLTHSRQVLNISWNKLAHEGRAFIPDSHDKYCGLGLKVEVLEDKLLRDLSREICSLLAVIASPKLNGWISSTELTGHANRTELLAKGLDVFAVNSLMGFMLMHKDIALPAIQLSVEALLWPDADSVGKITGFCGALILVAVSTNNAELKAFVAKDMFSTLIQCLALESHAFAAADLVGLCREIFIYLYDWDPSPRQVLLSLPHVTRNDLLAFEDALAKTASVKEQKQHMKSLLLLATGNTLKALAAQKGISAMTNVSVRARKPSLAVEPGAEDEVVGLALIT